MIREFEIEKQKVIDQPDSFSFQQRKFLLFIQTGYRCGFFLNCSDRVVTGDVNNCDINLS